jgi:hypothetical protein
VIENSINRIEESLSDISSISNLQDTKKTLYVFLCLCLFTLFSPGVFLIVHRVLDSAVIINPLNSGIILESLKGKIKYDIPNSVVVSGEQEVWLEIKHNNFNYYLDAKIVGMDSENYYLDAMGIYISIPIDDPHIIKQGIAISDFFSYGLTYIFILVIIAALFTIWKSYLENIVLSRHNISNWFNLFLRSHISLRLLFLIILEGTIVLQSGNILLFLFSAFTRYQAFSYPLAIYTSLPLIIVLGIIYVSEGLVGWEGFVFVKSKITQPLPNEMCLEEITAAEHRILLKIKASQEKGQELFSQVLLNIGFKIILDKDIDSASLGPTNLEIVKSLNKLFNLKLIDINDDQLILTQTGHEKVILPESLFLSVFPAVYKYRLELANSDLSQNNTARCILRCNKDIMESFNKELIRKILPDEQQLNSALNGRDLNTLQLGPMEIIIENRLCPMGLDQNTQNIYKGLTKLCREIRNKYSHGDGTLQDSPDLFNTPTSVEDAYNYLHLCRIFMNFVCTKIRPV